MRGPGCGRCGGIRRGAHSRFVGEHTPLKTRSECLAKGVTQRAGSRFAPAERALENGDDDVRHLIDMYRAYHQAGGHPQQRHQRNQPLHQAGNPFEPGHNGQQGEKGKRAARQPLRTIEGKAQRVGDGICLNGIENKAIGNQQKDREQNAHPAHSQPASHIPGGTAAKLTFAVFFFVELRKRAFSKGGGHTDNRRHPHPEYRARTARADCQRDTGQVTAADARGQAGTERLKRGQAARLWGDAVFQTSAKFADIAKLNQPAAPRKPDTCS